MLPSLDPEREIEANLTSVINTFFKEKPPWVKMRVVMIRIVGMGASCASVVVLMKVFDRSRRGDGGVLGMRE